MLEGIEILNKTEIMETPWWSFLPALGVAIVVGIIVMLLIGFLSDWHDCTVYITSIVAILSAFAVSAHFNNTIHTGRYKYEATIDKSVNFTELYEHYDIVDQRGEIWVIEDKEK